MKKTIVTMQQLEMLLENWGVFISTGHWGPRTTNECGSAERQWNSNPQRYVWEGNARAARPTECNDELASIIERIVQQAPMDYCRVLVRRYGASRHQPLWFAAESLRMTVAAYEAVLASARLFVLEQLEAMSYA